MLSSFQERTSDPYVLCHCSKIWIEDLSGKTDTHPVETKDSKVLRVPWLLGGTCWSLSSHLFQILVVQLHSRCSSDPESSERESFYRGWSFCGDLAFARLLNHQGQLQERTFGPQSAPNHSCTELQVHWKTIYSIGTDPSERYPAGEFVLCLTFCDFEPAVAVNMEEGGNDGESGPRIPPVIFFENQGFVKVLNMAKSELWNDSFRRHALYIQPKWLMFWKKKIKNPASQSFWATNAFKIELWHFY